MDQKAALEAEVQSAVERSPLMFDPWLTSDQRRLLVLADNLTDAYARQPGRERRLKQTDSDHLKAVLRTVLANLAYAALKAGPPEGPATFATIKFRPPAIAFSFKTARKRQTRYDRPGFTTLPVILERLRERLGLFDIRKSYTKGIASQIVVGDTLWRIVHALHFRPHHFQQIVEGRRDTIVLSRTERDYIDGTTTRELIHYDDTPETDRYGSEMERINAFLAKADLRMVDDDGPFVLTTARHLRRYFNLPAGIEEPRFDLGGRLFGGWWQELPRGRRGAIRINGEPIADLDFASMFLRLAYVRAGVSAPEGDLYAIPGLTGLTRDTIKTLVAAMLFRHSPMSKIPRDLKGEVPPGLNGRLVREAILAAHPALRGIFETGVGLSLMFTESRILVATLLKLVDQGSPALPMHDGIMVGRSKRDAARDAMAAASEQIIGAKLPIELK